MKQKSSIFVSLILFLAFVACRNSSLEELKLTQKLNGNQTNYTIDTSKTISFGSDIVPIMQSQCGSKDNNCHSQQAVASNLSSIDLTTYNGVKAAQEVDGLLYSSMIWDGNATKMPYKSKTKIDPLYIAAVNKWISNGMQNN